MDAFTLHRGSAPLLISLPHDGSALPDDIAARMTPAARRVPDTDWHVGRLYAFAEALGASILRPRWSRYVVDLNRPADGAALYPGRRETGLVPTITFAGEAIYRDGHEPDAAETAARVDTYWRPYHAALAGELARLRERHGRVVLWEGHSIRSVVPMFFDGRLPDLELQKNLNSMIKRHHVRLWMRPETVAGKPVWVGAATEDVGPPINSLLPGTSMGRRRPLAGCAPAPGRDNHARP